MDPGSCPQTRQTQVLLGKDGTWLGRRNQLRACRLGSALPCVSPLCPQPGGASGEQEMLTWDIVNIAAVHKHVAVLGVAERRQVGGVRRTGSDVAPHTAC